VVVPSNVFLAKQIEAGVFQPLDRSKLPNWNHLDPEADEADRSQRPGQPVRRAIHVRHHPDRFQPGQGQGALGDNAPVDSWDLIFKEENISKLKQCGVALLDSPSEILPLALQHLA
jgi:putrescine transport system substrate-binding protein